MRTRRFLSSLAAAVMLFSTFCSADEPANLERASEVYATPEKAYAAYEKAGKERDGQAALTCVTDRYRDVALWRAWEEQYYHMRQSRTLAKFIDEEKRLRLTRETLPVQQVGRIMHSSFTAWSCCGSRATSPTVR